MKRSFPANTSFIFSSTLPDLISYPGRRAQFWQPNESRVCRRTEYFYLMQIIF